MRCSILDLPCGVRALLNYYQLTQTSINYQVQLDRTVRSQRTRPSIFDAPCAVLTRLKYQLQLDVSLMSTVCPLWAANKRVCLGWPLFTG